MGLLRSLTSRPNLPNEIWTARETDVASAGRRAADGGRRTAAVCMAAPRASESLG